MCNFVRNQPVVSHLKCGLFENRFPRVKSESRSLQLSPAIQRMSPPEKRCGLIDPERGSAPLLCLPDGPRGNYYRRSLQDGMLLTELADIGIKFAPQPGIMVGVRHVGFRIGLMRIVRQKYPVVHYSQRCLVINMAEKACGRRALETDRIVGCQ